MIFTSEMNIEMCSVNAKNGVSRGRIFITKKYKTFVNDMIANFKRDYVDLRKEGADYKLTIHQRTYKDIGNCIKPIEDALTKAEIITDDRFILKEVIEKIPLKRGKLDYLRVQVEIIE